MEKSVLFKLSSLNMQLQVNSQIPQRLLQLLRLESLLEFVTTCADGIKGLKVHHGQLLETFTSCSQLILGTSHNSWLLYRGLESTPGATWANFRLLQVTYWSLWQLAAVTKRLKVHHRQLWETFARITATYPSHDSYLKWVKHRLVTFLV